MNLWETSTVEMKYIKDKPLRFGYKVFSFCSSETVFGTIVVNESFDVCKRYSKYCE